MPHRAPQFRPPWLAKRREERPSSSKRGYGTAAWERTRLAVIARDCGVCQLCGGLVLGNDRDAHIDHIIPKGTAPVEVTEALANLRLVHRSCHSKRHAAEGH